MEKFFPAFFPHFLSLYSCVYKKRVFALFPDDFLHRLKFAINVCFWKKIFSRFIPPIFWSRYSCFHKKKRVFAHFPRRFFSIVFISRYTCVFGKKIFSRVFPQFFGHDIRVFIKNVFSHFFQTIFSIVVCLRKLCVSGKKFSRVFPPFFVTIFMCL